MSDCKVCLKMEQRLPPNNLQSSARMCDVISEKTALRFIEQWKLWMSHTMSILWGKKWTYKRLPEYMLYFSRQKAGVAQSLRRRGYGVDRSLNPFRVKRCFPPKCPDHIWGPPQPLIVWTPDSNEPWEGKGKARHRTGHEGPERESRGIAVLFL